MKEVRQKKENDILILVVLATWCWAYLIYSIL